LVQKTIRIAIIAALAALPAAGCNANHQGSGTNDGMKTSNYRPFQFGAGNTGDMRLGLDRYRGTDPDLIRDNDSMRQGLNRDNGFNGWDQDGVNRWNDYQRNAANNPADSRVEASQEIAQQLVAIDPVQTANVLLAGRNAYVAITTKSGQDIDGQPDVKSRIAERVRQLRPEVENVYVSANPDFVSRINGYIEDVNAGRPVAGLFEELNQIVQRISPVNTANR